MLQHGGPFSFAHPKRWKENGTIVKVKMEKLNTGIPFVDAQKLKSASLMVKTLNGMYHILSPR